MSFHFSLVNCEGTLVPGSHVWICHWKPLTSCLQGIIVEWRGNRWIYLFTQFHELLVCENLSQHSSASIGGTPNKPLVIKPMTVDPISCILSPSGAQQLYSKCRTQWSYLVEEVNKHEPHADGGTSRRFVLYVRCLTWYLWHGKGNEWNYNIFAPKQHQNSRRVLTAFPGFVALAARNAAILSVVPVQTTQSLEKPAKISADISANRTIGNDMERSSWALKKLVV